MNRALLFAIPLFATACAAPGLQHRGWVGAPEVSVSMASDDAGEAHGLRAIGLGGRVVRQQGRWAVGAVGELHGFETRTLTDHTDRVTAVLFGAEGSVLSAQGAIRSSLALGAAVLVDGTAADEPGAVGVFADLRAVTLRLPLSPTLVLAFCPASGAFVVPEPSGIPLVDFQFRTNLSLEFL